METTATGGKNALVHAVRLRLQQCLGGRVDALIIGMVILRPSPFSDPPMHLYAWCVGTHERWYDVRRNN